MKRKVLTVLLMFAIAVGSKPARADLFGGDVAMLSQILIQAIMQLAKLKELLDSAKENIDLIQDINRGINDSLNLIRKIDPNLDPGIFRDWTTVDEAVRKVSEIYGAAPNSPLARAQTSTDQGVAEAVTFNNDSYKFAESYDSVADDIKDESHRVSPGGAQK